MSKILFCSVPGAERVDNILRRLRAMLPSERFSALFSQKGEVRSIILEKRSKVSEGVLAGVITGSALGAILGWLIGIGSWAVPGVDPFLFGGPMGTMLSGSVTGAAVGALIGSFIGLGISEVEAKEYGAKLKRGEALISVRVDSKEEYEEARRILQEGGGEHLKETRDLAA